MDLTGFSQTILFRTTPLDVYTILMDERRHSSFTGDFVQIEDSEDQPFSLADGLITGKNVVLERGRKIIWSFRMNKEGWPQDHFSEAAIILSSEQDGCRLELFHTAIPEAFAKELEVFWKHHYWEPLEYYLAR